MRSFSARLRPSGVVAASSATIRREPSQPGRGATVSPRAAASRSAGTTPPSAATLVRTSATRPASSYATAAAATSAARSRSAPATQPTSQRSRMTGPSGAREPGPGAGRSGHRPPRSAATGTKVDELWLEAGRCSECQGAIEQGSPGEDRGRIDRRGNVDQGAAASLSHRASVYRTRAASDRASRFAWRHICTDLSVSGRKRQKSPIDPGALRAARPIAFA